MDALANTFTRFFDVRPAVTKEQLRSALLLRYQVKCVETGFENSEQHPDGLEHDEFEARASHSLLIHRDSGKMTGTVRLVLPDKDDNDALFTIEKHCSGLVRPAEAMLQRSQIAEISRFCISSEYKGRKAVPLTLWGQPDSLPEEFRLTAQRRLSPHITVGLVAALVRRSAELHI